MAAGRCDAPARSLAASASAALPMRTATSSSRSRPPRRSPSSPSTTGASGAIRAPFASARTYMPERRRAFNLPGLAADGATAPDLVQVGGVFFTSGVRGVDRRTGQLPDDPGEQFLNAWHNLA